MARYGTDYRSDWNRGLQGRTGGWQGGRRNRGFSGGEGWGGYGGRGTYSGGWGGPWEGRGGFDRGGFDRGRYGGSRWGGSDRWDTEEGYLGGYGRRNLGEWDRDREGRFRGEYGTEGSDRDLGDRVREGWRGVKRSARGWFGGRGRGYDRGFRGYDRGW